MALAGLEGARTYARSLPVLDQAVREVIVLAADLPDEAMPGLAVDYDYHTGDPELDVTALEVRRLRREADELAAASAARTGQAADRLVASGLPAPASRPPASTPMLAIPGQAGLWGYLGHRLRG